ncbi:hypothetical protein B9Z55_021934 [Caenorhabditis nigoni]|uniref:Gamma-glutamyltransferase n=2 Tax=Caenorhabditis nigoni TaxID=1611254 RepID=A0A2G5TU82_9PELO|nr:hypothetical protein B9Z55_021934 [Caenorhabditis nigoni]
MYTSMPHDSSLQTGDGFVTRIHTTSTPSTKFEIVENEEERRTEPRKVTSGFKQFAVRLGLALLTMTVLLTLLLLFASPAAIRSEVYEWPAPSDAIERKFEKAALTSDNAACSKIGGEILRKGGNSIDASIASMFCLGVVNPQSSGIGGGFLMTYYEEKSGNCYSIDARETAPAAAHRDMFLNDSDGSKYGFKAAGTPGEIAGYWHVFKKFGSGKVTWKELVQPSVKLARDGHPVSPYLATVMKVKERHFRLFPSVKHWINPETNATYASGDILKRRKLAKTLERLGNSPNPVQLFYHGEMAKTMAKEFQEGGGLITEQDLANYKVREYVNSNSNDHFRGTLTMCGGPPPSSFGVTQLIISVMSKLFPEGHHDDIYQDPKVLHKYIEAMKFSYAQRTLLGDHDFVKGALELSKNLTTPEYTQWVIDRMEEKAQPSKNYGGIAQYVPPDHGTSHVSAMDQYGNGVSVTTTINRWFGAAVESTEFGILWNDEMDDFSTPGMENGFGFAPSETNFIEPGKRPMSSMSPMVIFDHVTKKVRMVIGGSGGSKIISALAKSVVRSLIFHDSIKKAIDAPMIHNQFTPDITQLDDEFPQNMKSILETEYLQKFRNTTGFEGIIQGVNVLEDGIYACGDYRRKTDQEPAGF